MKIVMISQYFWPEEFRINAICSELKKRGHEVEVLTGIPNYPQGRFYDGYSWRKRRQEEFEGIPITRVPIISRGKGPLQLIANYISFIVSARRNKYLKKFKDFDISLVYETSPITQAYPAIKLRRKYGVPTCMYVCDLWPESLQFGGNINNKLILHFVRKMVDGIYRKCDVLLLSSRGFEKNIREYNYPSERMMYFPNWAEDAYIVMRAEEGKRSAPIDAVGKFVVMYAGNVGEAQGFDVILEAAGLLADKKDIVFRILGNGRRLDEMKQKVQEQGLGNISFLGKRHFTKMSAYFSQASIMLATLKDHPIARLTLPGRIVSFMACGKPIITNIQGETADIIREAEAGLCCSPNSAKTLAEAINKAYNMPKEKLDKMGENALNYAKFNFNKDKLITDVILFINQIKKGSK